MRRLFSKKNLVLFLRILVAAGFVLPLYWILAAALQPLGLPLGGALRIVPGQATLANFRRAWDLLPFGRYALNTVLVAVLGTGITILSSSLVAFAISRLPRKGQERWVIFLLSVLMIPEAALWSTRFLLYKQLFWLDSIQALIAPAWIGTSPFYILMFYRAFRRIPGGIFDAAWVDGAGVFRTWFQIGLPLARPTAVGVGILSFVFYWGDYISPLLYLQSERWRTLSAALQTLAQLSRSDWSLLMAGTCVVAVIPVLIFLAIQPVFSRPDTVRRTVKTKF